ncbi:hypothetical protein NVV95_01025 [Herbiconiux sp. CPCC 205716]|uniref:Uncharacterized protein n=1 Tax=Herbiconiux gentiana TaxID=2970912 RepID=A0ABT2GA96_9MICO|nr:hypothetical protein [Herbiconiux gentiana]MCS5713126.1 hypothetical protein [Herbiconiux gentiana]
MDRASARRTLSPVLVTALLGALAAGLAGCAGGPPGTVGPTSAESPLTPYYDALYGNSSEEELQQRNDTVQTTAAACMKEQGFPYEPDPGSGISVQDAPSGGADWGSREFAEQYGYGVVSSPYAPTTGDEEWVDPNAGYLATLSEGERAAWEQALYGQPVEPASGAVPVWDWTTAGCMGKAFHEADLASGAAVGDPEFQGLVDELNGLSDEAASVDAVVTAERAWSDCLASAGHPGYEHRADPSADFSERFSALTRPDDPGDQAAGDQATGGDHPDVDQSALDALQDEEIATAVADFDCAQSSRHDELLAAEQHRVEQAFVDRNRAALDALVAKHGRN